MASDKNSNEFRVGDRVLNKRMNRKGFVKRVIAGGLRVVEVVYDGFEGNVHPVGISKLEKIEDETKKEQVI